MLIELNVKKKSLITIAGLAVLLIIALFIVRFIFGGAEDDWICSDSGWVKHGNPSSEMPTSGCD